MRAMQQQLSSLHLVMEQSGSEQEKQLQLLTTERDRERRERERCASITQFSNSQLVTATVEPLSIRTPLN